MYTRSLTERIRIQFEILLESFSDFMGRNAMRKPLLMLAGVAVVMTMKNARYSINYMKTARLSPFKSKYAKTSGLFSPYGTATHPTTSSFGSNRATTGQYGGASASGTSYGQPAPAFGAAAGTSGYPPSNRFGASNQGAAQGFGNNLRGTSAASPAAYPGAPSIGGGGFSTSSLVDKYGTQVSVVQGGLFHDYGSSGTFSGQIDTVSAQDAPGFVEQILRSPGAGKVLVVDGGGMSSGALFDASMVSVAQQNGWKGVIINGYVRNAPQLQTMPFGVKALGTHPSKGMQTMGQRSGPLMFGGVNFSPGAFVYADKDGIVVSQMNLDGGAGGMYGGGTNTMPGGGMAGAQMNGMAGAQMNGMSQPNGYGSPAGGQQSFGNARGAVGGGFPSANTNGFQQPASSGYGQPATGGLGGAGGTRPLSPAASSFGRSNGASSFSSRSKYAGGRRKKPSKKTLMAILLFICAVVYVLLGD